MFRPYLIAFALVAATFSVTLFGSYPAAAQAPSITITSPNLVAVSDLGFQMQVAVADFILDQENYGGLNIPGHGHIHYTVDGALAGATWLTVFNFGSLADGGHVVRAELRNNDHSPLSPAVFDEITVTAVPPLIGIVSPEVTAVSTLGFQTRVTVSGFILDEANYAGTNIAGQGHIHYTVDGALAGATTSTVFNFGSLTAGAHTIRAELRNNDHSALAPPVFQEIAVTAAAPSIAIISPKIANVPTLGLRIEVTVSGFILDEVNYAGTNIAGQGHIHYTVDGALAAATTSTAVTLSSLTAGAHAIRAELRNNDHSALSPPVFQEISVTAGAPSIAIVSPEVTSVSTLGFRIEVVVAGFILDEANYAGTNIAGQGHIHYTVDGALAAATTATAIDIGPLAAGAHTIRAELRNNDHSALSPPVFQEVTVTAGTPQILLGEPLADAQTSTLGFRIRVDVSSFVLDEANYAGTNIAGQGHIHYTVDGTLASATTLTTVTLGPLTSGAHTIRAELRNNDHSALSPAVFDEFSVTAAAPSIQVSLSATSIEAGQAVVVSWTVGGFVLDAVAFGGAPEAGRGHVHAFVDGTLRDMSTGNALAISGLTEGSHTIRAGLYNNDHSALTPAVSSEATVQVNPVPPAPAPTIDALVFYGTVIALLVVIAVLAGVLVMRRGRAKGEGLTEKKT